MSSTFEGSSCDVPDDGVASREAFCMRISERLSHDGFRIEIQPGVHLVDDLGADSLVILNYVLALEELGLSIDLAAFDTDLLDTEVAYKAWIRTVAARAALKSGIMP
jgi:acyl carrier protein